MTSPVEKANRLMGEFLCRKNPGVSAVKMWSTMYRVAALPLVASGEATLKDDSIQNRTWIGEHRCEGVRP